MDDINAFVFPPTEIIKKERYLSELSETERELYFLREDMLEGKIPLLVNCPNNRTSYEDAVGCVLFHAVDAGKITQKESHRLYREYVR